MATTVNELPAGSGSKIAPTPGSNSLSRVSTRLYCSVQNAAASSFPPVHSDCNAMRDVRRSTLINLTNSFSLSIVTPSLTHIQPQSARIELSTAAAAGNQNSCLLYTSD